MKIGSHGLEIIKKWEGFKAQAYLDPIKIPTIGYGTIKVDGKPVKLGMTCTKEQAEKWLEEHVNEEVVPCIEKLVKVPLTQYQFDALCSFIYNLGCGNFSNSTLLRLLNEKDYLGASKQFIKWNRAGGKILTGLTNRRRDETSLFLKYFDVESSS